MNFVKLIFTLVISSIFYNTAYTENCDLDDIKRMVGVTGELSLYPSGFVNDGDKRTLKCKRPSGVYQPENIVESSIVAYCKNGVFNFQGKSCAEACDVSNALQLNFGIDFKNTKLTDGSKISSSKLVPLNSKIKIQCLENYRVQDSNQNYYIYECGKPNDIKKCIPNPVVIDVKPPKSNTSDNFKPMLKCNVNDIVAPNGKRITEVNTFSDLNTEVEIACEGGYSVYGGQEPNKISQKYKIKCDPQGTGKWIGLKACTKRCDVTALVKATTNTLISSVDLLDENNKYLGFVKDKNSSNSTTIYTETNSTVRVKCNADYEVRSLNKPYYDTSCLDGSNFDVGSNVPKCERIIKPCNNKDITVTGILQQPSLATSVTNVGQRVAFKCQGDAIQEGNYFKYGNNENKGANGIPVCEYDSSNPNQSKWSHTTFKCYDGCISEEGDVVLKTNFSNIITRTKILPFAIGDISNLYTSPDSYFNPNSNTTVYLITQLWGNFWMRPGIPVIRWDYGDKNVKGDNVFLTQFVEGMSSNDEDLKSKTFFNHSELFKPISQILSSYDFLEALKDIYQNPIKISALSQQYQASKLSLVFKSEGGDISRIFLGKPVGEQSFDIGMAILLLAKGNYCSSPQTQIIKSQAYTLEIRLSTIYNYEWAGFYAVVPLLPTMNNISYGYNCPGQFGNSVNKGIDCLNSLKNLYKLSAGYNLGEQFETRVQGSKFFRINNCQDLLQSLKEDRGILNQVSKCNGMPSYVSTDWGLVRKCDKAKMEQRGILYNVCGSFDNL